MKYIVKNIPNKLTIYNTNKQIANQILLVTPQGIIIHGKKNYKQKFIDKGNKIYNLTKNIQLIEDASTVELSECYQIPTCHYEIHLKKISYRINNIVLEVTYHNKNIFDISIVTDNYNNIIKNKDTLISLLQ